ncbi:hypothetical protein V7S43_016393 [Phytophthora oleae]|uniref:TAZ-type domain-containing protein n=1 Tax=Phytophthora oleae TaxID=2107226 RepID=A0ABD3EZA4_9STRA
MANLDGDGSGNDSSDNDSVDMDLGGQRAAADKMPQETVKRLIRQAMLTTQFPPHTACSEFDRSCDLATSLFDFPVLVWVPDCLNAGQKPHCPNAECSCAPRLKEYRQRLCEDIDFRCRLLYVKYQCMGNREPRSCLSTVCDAYLNREVRTMIHFPFILTKKDGCF